MAVILEKTPGIWKIFGLFGAVFLAKLIDGRLPEDIDNSHMLIICIIFGVLNTEIFFEELREKYFLDYEEKRDSAFRLFIFLGISLVFLFFGWAKENPTTLIRYISLLLRYTTEFLIVILSFLTTIYLQSNIDGISYRESHKKTEELCKKIYKVKNSPHSTRNADAIDDFKDLLDILESLKENLEKNKKMEKEKDRIFLRRFMDNIITLEILFRSYYNFYTELEALMVFRSTNYPKFLHKTSGSSSISFSRAFQIALESIPKFKNELKKERIERIFVKPLFAFIPGCKTYDELFSWKHPKHNLSIGEHNDAIIMELFERKITGSIKQPLVVFDLYGKPPSYFNNKADFILQLKESVRNEKKLISCKFI